MRLLTGTLPLLVLVLVACGTPTDNSTTSTDQYNASSAASIASAAATTDDAALASQAAAAAGAVETADRNDKYSAAPAMTIDQNKSYTATIETTKGTMQAELFAKDAPITVNNFVFLARDGYYDKIRFHRIIKDFMVQTGDPLGTGTGGPGYAFKDEPVTRSYTRGTLAMANSGKDTNGSQFFIVHQDYPLQPNYTIFGQVTQGLDVLDAIANTPVTADPNGEQSVPTEDVRIIKITITE